MFLDFLEGRVRVATAYSIIHHDNQEAHKLFTPNSKTAQPRHHPNQQEQQQNESNMGNLVSFFAVIFADLIRPGWRTELCNAVSVLDSCECAVTPSSSFFSFFSADVSASCPTPVTTLYPSWNGCVYPSTGVYCFDDCTINMQGTAGLLTMALDFTATAQCAVDKTSDFINNPIQQEFDAVSMYVTGSGDAATSTLDLTGCGPGLPGGMSLNGNAVGNCRCDLNTCGSPGLMRIDCDAIGNFPALDFCLDTTVVF